MKTDNHNDWADAFRESFPEEVRPEAGGWETVAGRMRRAAARRRAVVAAAVLALPVAAGILFLPSRPDTNDNGIAVVETPAPAALTPGSDPESASSNLIAEVSSTMEEDSFVGLRPPRNDNKGTPSRNVIPSEVSVIPSEAKESIPPALAPTNTDTVKHVHEAAMPSDNTASLIQGDLPELFEEDAEEPARARRLAVGIGGGATAGGTPTTVTTTTLASGFMTKAPMATASNNFFNNTSGTILQHRYVHDLPVSLGLSARYGITDRLWLESGLEFTRMHSRLEDLNTVMLFAGIPLRVDYTLFSSRSFEAYAGIGGKAEKCLKATLGGMKVSEPKLQWSASALAGAQMRLTGNAWLFLQPDLTYYFTKTSLLSYRTENRLGLTFHAGLRFDITRH
ncbi:MAG: hypothetical protein J5374_11385 [Bacteroidales bacterium]|nr:hypothetical protein [Bacteroidales bacterium]